MENRYRTNANDGEVLAFGRQQRPFAVTMPIDRALRGTLARDLANHGIRSYAHTVNDPSLLNHSVRMTSR